MKNLIVASKFEIPRGEELYQETFDAEQSRSCDVALKVNGSILLAHSDVLVSRSDYFSCLFGEQFAPVDRSNIDMSDVFILHSAARDVHKFIYTAEITLTEENAIDVLHIASFLLLDDLVFAVEQFFVNNLTVENSVTLNYWGQTYQLEELKELTVLELSGRLSDAFPLCGLIEQVEFEELACFVDCGLQMSSSAPGLVLMILAWFRRHPRDRFNAAKSLCRRIQRQSFGIESVLALALDEEERDIVETISCPRNTGLNSQACIVQVSLIPDYQGKDRLPHSLVGYSTCVNIYFKSTEEWLSLPACFISRSDVPTSCVNTFNKYWLKEYVKCVSVTGTQLVLVAFGSGNETRRRDCVIILNLETKQVQLFPGVLGQKRYYFEVHGVVIVVCTSQIGDEGKIDNLTLLKLEPTDSSTWVPVGNIPAGCSGGPKKSFNGLLEFVSVVPANKDSGCVFQVYKDTSRPHANNPSFHQTRVIGHHVNLTDRAVTRITSFGDNAELCLPHVSSIQTVVTHKTVSFFFETYGKEVHHLCFDWMDNRWNTEKANDSWFKNEFAGFATSKPKSEMTNFISLPDALYKVVQYDHYSQLSRYSPESGKVVVLPPPPVMTTADIQAYCGGWVDVESLSALAAPSSLIGTTTYYPEKCSAFRCVTRAFRDSGLLSIDEDPPKDGETPDDDCENWEHERQELDFYDHDYC